MSTAEGLLRSHATLLSQANVIRLYNTLLMHLLQYGISFDGKQAEGSLVLCGDDSRSVTQRVAFIVAQFSSDVARTAGIIVAQGKQHHLRTFDPIPRYIAVKSI